MSGQALRRSSGQALPASQRIRRRPEFERVYGPAYYSYDYGSVHFLVLDDVNWIGKTEAAITLGDR